MFDFLKSLSTARMTTGTVATTGGLAVLGSWLLARVQALTPVLLVLLATMVLDYVTGLVKAGITGEINSTKGWQGLLKKVMYIVTVAVAFIADYVAHYTAEQFGWEMDIAAYFAILVSVWLIINEAISIIENLSEIGVPMPAFLVKIFHRVHNKVSEAGETNIETMLSQEVNNQEDTTEPAEKT